MNKSKGRMKPSRPVDLVLGSLVMATRTTGVCKVGEVGVVYEVYPRHDVYASNDRDGEGGYGYSVIFEQGKYDGWSMEDVAMGLRSLGAEDPSLAAYQFQNVGLLARDYTRGLFTPAFVRAHTLMDGQPQAQEMVSLDPYPPSGALY